jgi:nitrate reductase NapAB chaperone NapD
MIISGVLVHAQPEKRVIVENRLAEMPNVEVVNATPQGQLVVVIEEDDKSTGALLKDIHFLENVLSASLVYQESLPDVAL